MSAPSRREISRALSLASKDDAEVEAQVGDDELRRPLHGALEAVRQLQATQATSLLDQKPARSAEHAHCAASTQTETRLGATTSRDGDDRLDVLMP